MSIEAKNLLKIYGRRKVVNDVEFNVERGEVVGLLGPNGAGKTTTFYMVVGLIKPNKGSIFLDGKNISKFPMYKRARLGLGYLPQEASVFRKLTVEENILAIWQLRGGAPSLSIKEKILLALRQPERAWWKRNKYKIYYNNLLNDHNKLTPEQQYEFNSILTFYEGSHDFLRQHADKVLNITKIIQNLEMLIPGNTQKVVEFINEYIKFYKLGKKKKIEEFLNLLWKAKRDEIFSEFRNSESKIEKVNLLSQIIRILDIENESLFKTIENFPEIETVNKLNEYLSFLEKIYWFERKEILDNKSDEINHFEQLKKDKLHNELNEFLESNSFREYEMKDILESIQWNRKVSQKIQLEDILDEFNISHIRSSKGSDLSGGERRRVEIARAVAIKPSFLLLDEPFAGIDPIAVAGIKEMIVLLKNRNIGVLITDHNVRETLKIIDRGYILSDGKVIEHGSKEHLANSEIARKHYLGEDFSL